jgi:hypothetical protein
MLSVVEVDKVMLVVVFVDVSVELDAIVVEMEVVRVLAEVVDVIFSVDCIPFFAKVIRCG